MKVDFLIRDQNSESVFKFDSFRELIFWGDPIITHDIAKLKSVKNQEDLLNNILTNVLGHYYFCLIDSFEHNLTIGNSFFSILPLYYFSDQSTLLISNSPITIAKNINNRSFNKRFILENILFNYPLFNNSCIENIRLTPSNSYLKISSHNTFKIIKHTNIENHFGHLSPNRKKNIEEVAELFIQRSKRYFPREFCYVALTGGFDGRALTACGMFHKKKFETYSFGSKSSLDSIIANELAESVGIEHKNLSLDQSYVQENSLPNGLEFVLNSFGNAAFTRSHYLWSAKLLSQTSNFVVTGNFGSEIFRAPHISGALFNRNLISLFEAISYDEAIHRIENSPEMAWLQRTAFTREMEALKEDLINLIESFP